MFEFLKIQKRCEHFRQRECQHRSQREIKQSRGFNQLEKQRKDQPKQESKIFIKHFEFQPKEAHLIQKKKIQGELELEDGEMAISRYNLNLKSLNSKAFSSKNSKNSGENNQNLSKNKKNSKNSDLDQRTEKKNDSSTSKQFSRK